MLLSTRSACLRELHPDVTSVFCVDGQIDDLTIVWQPVDARLTERGVTGADRVDEMLFLQRTRRCTIRQRLWLG